MSNENKINSIYKHILGDAKNTIDSIQRYIQENSRERVVNDIELEKAPAESINKILNSTTCSETNTEIQKIIKNL